MDPAHQTQSAPSQQPSTPQPVNNGDNSTITGDNPMLSPTISQVVSQEEQTISNNMTSINTAQVLQNSLPVAKLGDKGESYDQIRKLGEKIENAVLPEELKKLLIERVSRLALIRSGAGFMSSTYILEYEATARYVTWCVGLPWDKKSQDLLDLAKAREILDRNHYGLRMLKQRVLEHIASIMLNIKNNGPDFLSRSSILCFVGLAGTGKTTFAKSVAEALGRKFERIPFGGMADSRVLRGQSRYFPDAEPGAVVKKMVHAEVKNPVILLDELDRVTETARADIMGVLIELLDPEQNSAFTDHYIDYPFNLSNALFVATANNTTAISTAVLDRLEIIQMPSYSDEEKMMIGKSYVFPKTRQLVGLKPEQITIAEDVWGMIIRPLGYDSGIRSLERTISGMCRKAAQLIIEGKSQAVQITAQNVKQFLPEY